MLANLLPGLRQLRAPLAAGYLWLVAAWLEFAAVIPLPKEVSTGVFKDVYEIGGAIGPSAATAAASFAAYIVGVLSVQATTMALPVLRRKREIAGRRHWGLVMPSAAGIEALREAVKDQLARRYDTDPELKKLLEKTRESCGELRELTDPDVRRTLLNVRIDVDRYAEKLKQDLPLIPYRMLAEEKDHKIYSEFDRLRAEAEFRAAVALPLAVIVAVVAWRTSPWWALALVVPALLALEAARATTAATDVLAESIRARPCDSPVLSDVQGGPLEARKNWLTFAADSGYARAMALLADDLEKANDPQKAEHWYRKAAELGDPPAMFSLAGRLHRRGDPEAERWYAKAEEEKEPRAEKIAAMRKILDLGDLANLKAAYADDPEAMTEVGKVFAKRGNEEEALNWLCKAGYAGYVPAMWEAAEVLTASGKHAAAKDWRRRASEASRDHGPGCGPAMATGLLHSEN